MWFLLPPVENFRKVKFERLPQESVLRAPLLPSGGRFFPFRLRFLPCVFHLPNRVYNARYPSNTCKHVLVRDACSCGLVRLLFDGCGSGRSPTKTILCSNLGQDLQKHAHSLPLGFVRVDICGTHAGNRILLEIPLSCFFCSRK